MAHWLVVGLGNPGPTYAANRHNIGAMVVEELARRGAGTWKAHRLLRADIARVRISSAGIGAPGLDAQIVDLARTKTYMNISGAPVRNALGYLKLPESQLVVVHDEIDLDLSRMRVKFGGGDNGHNGLRSIRATLGTGEFFRVRLGVGRNDRVPVEKWVLTDFPKTDSEEVKRMISLAADCVESLVTSGLDAAQQRYNS